MEVSAGLSSLKLAKDMLQAMNGVHTAVQINDVKFTLQGHILDAQQGLFAAQEAQADASKRIATLEQEILGLKDWETEKQRYALKRYYPSAFAYALKPEMAAGEPPHRLCANCYQQGKKSILQGTAETVLRHRIFRCPLCKTEGPLSHDEQPEQTAE
jgi:hypothetical protein